MNTHEVNKSIERCRKLIHNHLTLLQPSYLSSQTAIIASTICNHLSLHMFVSISDSFLEM